MPTISETFTAAALAQPNLDEAADVLAGAVNGAYAAAGPNGRTLKDIVNGTWLGHPLHPVITDIPIGAWTAVFVLDAFGERRGARIAVGLGLLGAVGAAITGLTDWADVYGKPRKLGVVHAALNGTATLMYAASFLARAKPGPLGIAFSTLGYGLVSLSALYGGVISLDLQVGVNRAHPFDPPEDETDVAALADIPDGGMLRVDADKYPVLLVRRGNDVSAIAALCAHRGGPLDEGTLDGDLVTCPWHGSQFCVTDGHVVHGPSAYAQPAFEVSVRDGRVLLRGLKPGAL